MLNLLDIGTGLLDDDSDFTLFLYFKKQIDNHSAIKPLFSTKQKLTVHYFSWNYSCIAKFPKKKTSGWRSFTRTEKNGFLFTKHKLIIYVC